MNIIADNFTLNDIKGKIYGDGTLLYPKIMIQENVLKTFQETKQHTL